MNNGKKPRDVCGNDLLVPATAFAMIIARAEGKEKDIEYVRKLSFEIYSEVLKTDMPRTSCDIIEDVLRAGRKARGVCPECDGKGFIDLGSHDGWNQNADCEECKGNGKYVNPLR